MSSLKEIRKNGKHIYNSLKAHRFVIYKCKLIFTNRGWNHVAGYSKVRTVVQIRTRVGLLSKIPLLLSSENNLVYLRENFLSIQNDNLKLRAVFVKKDEVYIFISIFKVYKKR